MNCEWISFIDPLTGLTTRCRVGWGFDFAFVGYGDKWRTQRRMFHQHFNAHAMLKYGPHFPRVVRQTLLRLLDHPDDFMEHLRQWVFVYFVRPSRQLSIVATKHGRGHHPIHHIWHQC